MTVIGIQVGNSFTKAASATASTVFPSVAVPARMAQNLATDETERLAQVDMNGSGTWIIGADALAAAPGLAQGMLDVERYDASFFKACARYALTQVVGRPAGGSALGLMSSMPGAWYEQASARTALETALRQAAMPWGVRWLKIVPEAQAVFYDYMTEGGQLQPERAAGEVGILDLGYRDVNIGLVVNGRHVRTESIPGGMQSAIAAVRRLIGSAYRVELSDYATDAAIREGSVMVAGGTRPLPEGTVAALHGALQPIVHRAASLWPSGGRTLRAVVAGGGGLYALAAPLLMQYPHLIIPGAGEVSELDQSPERLRIAVQQAAPHLSGARGLARMGQFQDQRQGVARGDR